MWSVLLSASSDPSDSSSPLFHVFTFFIGSICSKRAITFNCSICCIWNLIHIRSIGYIWSSSDTSDSPSTWLFLMILLHQLIPIHMHSSHYLLDGQKWEGMYRNEKASAWTEEGVVTWRMEDGCWTLNTWLVEQVERWLVWLLNGWPGG